VDRESCRALGVSSVIACPIVARDGEIIGILEVFSPEDAAFWANDGRTLERLARIIANAVSRAKHPIGRASQTAEPEEKPENKHQVKADSSIDNKTTAVRPSPGVRTAVVFGAGLATVILGVWLVAPWISDALNKLTSPPSSQAAEVKSVSTEYVGMDIADLEKIALRNNPAAQYSLGMKYASGDGTAQNYHEALGWFLKAADNGDARAAAKIARCFWAGKGAPRDYSKAYFWGLVAQAAGDQTGRVIVVNSAVHLSDHQRIAEQREADSWLRSHRFAVYSSRASR
jgi:hypothetical protein